MTSSDLLREAEGFITECSRELGYAEQALEKRLTTIRLQIERTGTYYHTYEELQHGARMAWRNSNRCIGRLFWSSLEVFDRRHLEDESEIAEALVTHMRFATNKGKIRPTISIFRQELPDAAHIRLWNHQLIRYAGYESPQGVLGDPASVELTKACQSLGWQGKGTAFDPLPLVVQVGERQPYYFSVPDDCVLEVPISHPTITGITELGLKWYAVPFIADMALEIGGIRYSAAPFNGWYMETEIGARNLADSFRYDMLPAVAEAMGLATASNVTLWKDRALIELNAAVLHSYKEAGVSIVDHHTAAEQFRTFEEQERKAGRSLTGNWSWLIPPLSPASTHIFHKQYEDRMVNPNYYKQVCPYRDVTSAEAAAKAGCPITGHGGQL